MEKLTLQEQITAYIQSRAASKLEKFDKNSEKVRKTISDPTQLAIFDADTHNDRAKIATDFTPNNWLTDAAKRARQISMVTHALKFTHTDAKGSSLYDNAFASNSENDLTKYYISTASLPNPEVDCVGNAAALDVANLLLLTQENKRLIDFIAEDDDTPLKPFATSAAQLNQWMEDFAQALVNKQPSSHTLAKQIYFPINETDYHLLSPIFASSLAHELHAEIIESRFSETAKLARKSRREEKHHEAIITDYPDIVLQSFGGTKPQNVSQLNAKRGGSVYLFNCAPPHFDEKHKSPPIKTKNIFDDTYDHRVKKQISQLRGYLFAIANQTSTVSRRDQRKEYVDELVHSLLDYAQEVREFTPGWSEQSQLPRAQQLWLDPHRQNHDLVFRQERIKNEWPLEIASSFATWLNRKISKKDRLVMGDAEWETWYKCVKQRLYALPEDLLLQEEIAEVV